MNIKKRILLKISGGQLKDNKNQALFDEATIQNLVSQISFLSKTYNVGIVLGGGNIWRGKNNHLDSFDNVSADYVGMLATVMNGIVLKSLLRNAGIKSKLFSALNCPKISFEVNQDAVEEAFFNNEVVIFSGGTGSPFVTTDTAAAIRAIEINASILLIGKDGVKGVYDKDPNIHKDAKFFSKLTYDLIIKKELKVIDNTALTIAKEQNLKIFVFNQSINNAFVKAINKEIELTEIFND